MFEGAGGEALVDQYEAIANANDVAGERCDALNTGGVARQIGPFGRELAGVVRQPCEHEIAHFDAILMAHPIESNGRARACIPDQPWRRIQHMNGAE